MLLHVHIDSEHDARQGADQRDKTNARANEGGFDNSFRWIVDGDCACDRANYSEDGEEGQAEPAELAAKALLECDIAADEEEWYPEHELGDEETFAGEHLEVVE